MRKITIAIGLVAAAAVLLAAGSTWKADAASWRSGTLNLPGLVQNYSPIDQIACKGWGRCPPGFRYKCRPVRGCRCMACF